MYIGVVRYLENVFISSFWPGEPVNDVCRAGVIAPPACDGVPGVAAEGVVAPVFDGDRSRPAGVDRNGDRRCRGDPAIKKTIIIN